MKNEKTSKAVASEAAKVLSSAKRTLARIRKAKRAAELAYAGLEEAEDVIGRLASIAASALTQAPDRKPARTRKGR